MASTKKTTDQVEQKPILTKGSSVKEVKEVKSKKRVVPKSRRRTSLDEFAVVNNLRAEVKAGFKVWLEGNLFHFDDEWMQLFEDYQNRTL